LQRRTIYIQDLRVPITRKYLEPPDLPLTTAEQVVNVHLELLFFLLTLLQPDSGVDSRLIKMFRNITEGINLCNSTFDDDIGVLGPEAFPNVFWVSKLTGVF